MKKSFIFYFINNVAFSKMEVSKYSKKKKNNQSNHSKTKNRQSK